MSAACQPGDCVMESRSAECGVGTGVHAAAATAPAPGLASLPRAATAGLLGTLPEGEVVILALKPSVWFIVLSRLGWLVAITLAGVAWNLLSDLGTIALPRSTIFSATAALVAMVLAWRLVDWQQRLYVLTDRRVLRVSGIVRQTTTEIPLGRVQSVSLHKSVRERVCGLGSIGISSGSAAAAEVGWYMLRRPHDALAKVRDAVDRHGRRGGGGGVDGGGA